MSHWEKSRGLSDDWYTPGHVFTALNCRFDLDVAGDRTVPAYCVPADSTISKDSLAQSWRGFVWMNPPFGGRNGLDPWLTKFFEHDHGIALTPDRTSAPWFQAAWPKASTVLFTRKIRFLRPDGTEGVSPNCGTALWSAGLEASEILTAAAGRGFGILATPQQGLDHA